MVHKTQSPFSLKLAFAYVVLAITCLSGAIFFVLSDLSDGQWGTPRDLIAALSLTGVGACALIAAAVYILRQVSSKPSGVRLHFQPFLYAAYISLGYAVLGCIYTLLSTQLVHLISDSQEYFRYFEWIKGCLFIFITSLLLLGFTYFPFSRITRDAQQIVMQKEALIEASKRATTGIFAASIAHDAGNILASLRFGLEMLERANSASNESSELMNTLHRAVRELSSLNRHLLETGYRGVSTDFKELDLVVEIKATLALARINQRTKYCTLSLEGDAHLCCLANPTLISEMLLNLVLNAADATHNRGRVLIYVYKTEDTAHIEVHDNGPGIPQEDVQRIFEPFYTTKQNGTGLGLLTVKACAELHKGQLLADRSPTLGGALFAITFPVQHTH